MIKEYLDNKGIIIKEVNQLLLKMHLTTPEIAKMVPRMATRLRG